MATQQIAVNELRLYFGTAETRATTNTGAAGERLPIANSIDTTLTITTDVADVTNQDSNRWREIIRAQRSWSLSGSMHMDDLKSTLTTHRRAEEIQALAISGEPMYVEFVVTNTGWKGNVIVTDFSPTQGTNDESTASFSAEGNGQLEFDADVTGVMKSK